MGTTDLPDDSSEQEPRPDHADTNRDEADEDALEGDDVGAGDGGGEPEAVEGEADEAGPIRRVRVLSSTEGRSGGGERPVRFARPESMGWQRTALSVVVLGAVIGLLAWAVNAGMADPDAARTSSSDAAGPATSTTTTSTTTTTTAPPPTTAAPRPIDLEAAGQGCTQLANKGYSYGDALSYYLRTGEPERMDPDHDDMPCESNYSDDEKSQVWAERQAAGESVPTGAL